jgi:transposase
MSARACCRSLREKVRRLARENRRLGREVERLRADNARLRSALAEAQRAGKRQAAPFSKGRPTSCPRRPGRRPGRHYGPKAFRPPPERVHEIVPVPLPESCPHCHAPHIELIRTAPQFQVDLPPIAPHVVRFDVAIGRCAACQRRLQGRHPRQTSNALGAAASQLGPAALALAADLNKGLGLSFDKTRRLFATAFGIAITRGGLCLALHRVARAAEPTYQALGAQLRRGVEVVTPDETGWKVGGELHWLWAFATVTITVYAIQAGRGFAEAAAILGADFAGTLTRDGWAPYRGFAQALHQSCLGHLLRRCHDNLLTAERGTARFPHAVKRVLQHALELRDRRDLGAISPHGLAVSLGRLEARCDRLLRWHPVDDENRKLVQHLRTERGALFTFLHHPEVEATNWRAEQAIRPAVVTRKVCGGNRTWNGAHTQQVLATVLRTCQQQDQDRYAILAALLRAPAPRVATVLLHPALRRRLARLTLTRQPRANGTLHGPAP